MSPSTELFTKNWNGNYTYPFDIPQSYNLHHTSIISSIANTHTDSEKAINELKTLINQQHDDGFIPGLITFNDDHTSIIKDDVWVETPTNISSYFLPFSANPILVTAFREWFEKTNNEDVVKKYVSNLDAFLEWWKYKRKYDNSSLVYTRHPWETLLPSSTTYNNSLSRISTQNNTINYHKNIPLYPYNSSSYYNPCISLLKQAKQMDEIDLRNECELQVINPLLNTLYYQACNDLSFLYDSLGFEKRASKWRFEAKSVKSSLSVHLWDIDTESFCSYDMIDGSFIHSGIDGYGTLFAKVPIYPRANKIIMQINNNRSDTGHGCCNGDNGEISPLFNWLVITGLEKYGKHKDADIMTDITLDICDEKSVQYYKSNGDSIGNNECVSTSCVRSLLS